MKIIDGKLTYLHEFLRDCNNKYDLNDFIYAPKEAPFVDFNLHLADTIETFYMPLPADANGVPWKIGDECTLITGERVTIIGYVSKDTVYVSQHCSCERYKVRAAILKRILPPRFDVNDVEIKVGDTVWVDGASPEVNPDAEMSYEYGGPLEVVKYNEARNSVILCKNCRGDLMDIECDTLTHVEPDSISKILSDSKLHPVVYCKKIMGMDMVDEISGAHHIFAKDIMRRQRIVIERDSKLS